MELINLLDKAVIEGLAFALVPLSCYITYRLLNFPDVTVDGSFVLGGSICALLVTKAGWNPWPATLLSIPIGGLAGACTGFLNVKLGINKLLAGILVAFALYSVNLLLIGASVAFPHDKTIIEAFRSLDKTNPLGLSDGLSLHPAQVAFFLIFFLLVKTTIDLYLASESGLMLRASPYCPEMIWHKGSNPDRRQILGVAIANSMVALCGAVIAQKEGAANSFRGTGMIIMGIAAYIIGEQTLNGLAGMRRSLKGDGLSRARNWSAAVLGLISNRSNTLAPAIGAILYFCVVHLGYRLRLNPALPRLMMAVFLVIILGDWRRTVRR